MTNEEFYNVIESCPYKQELAGTYVCVEHVMSCIKAIRNNKCSSLAAIREAKSNGTMEYWLKGNMPTYGGYKCSKCGYQTTRYKLWYCPACKSIMHTDYVGYKKVPKKGEKDEQADT